MAISTSGIGSVDLDEPMEVFVGLNNSYKIAFNDSSSISLHGPIVVKEDLPKLRTTKLDDSYVDLLISEFGPDIFLRHMSRSDIIKWLLSNT